MKTDERETTDLRAAGPGVRQKIEAILAAARPNERKYATAPTEGVANYVR